MPVVTQSSAASLADRMVAAQASPTGVGRVFVTRPRETAETDVVQLTALRDPVATRGLARVARALVNRGVTGIELRPIVEPGFPPTLPELVGRLAAEGLGVVSWLLPYYAADPRTRTLAGRLDETLDLAGGLGLRFVGTASAPNRYGTSADGYRRAAADFSSFAEAAASRGLTFVYHNHAADFASDPVTGERFFDVLFRASSPAVGFELDLHWVALGTRLHPGFDPLECVREHPDRFPLFHVRDSAFELNARENGAIRAIPQRPSPELALVAGRPAPRPAYDRASAPAVAVG